MMGLRSIYQQNREKKTHKQTKRLVRVEQEDGHKSLTKSTRSSASQWKHLRNKRNVNMVTNLGLKSSRNTVKAKHVSVMAYQLRSSKCLKVNKHTNTHY